MQNTKAVEAWVGANSEETARILIETKHPEIKEGRAQLVNLRQTISGMWSYRIEWEEEETPAEEVPEEGSEAL